MQYNIVEQQLRLLPEEALDEVAQFIKNISKKYNKTPLNNSIKEHLLIGYGLWKDSDITLQAIRKNAWIRSL